MNKLKTDITPEAILEDHPQQIRAVAENLRRMIKDAFPEVTEKAYPGGHGIGYRHPKAGYFGCIFPSDDEVTFAFEHGASLPDPENLLVRPPTSSKQVRYVHLHSEADINEDAMIALLHAAVSLKS
jgi:hypothetical protein